MNKVVNQAVTEPATLQEGDILLIDEVYYIIANVNYEQYSLISLEDGKRFEDPMRYGELLDLVRKTDYKFIGRNLTIKIEA